MEKKEVWILIHPDGRRYELSREDIEAIVDAIEMGENPPYASDRERLLRKMGLRHMAGPMLDFDLRREREDW